MLTRLEVKGFKNLRSVVLDLGPFTCIAGENGVGKSNVFDAIEFLSLLTSLSFGEAVQELRGDRGSRAGDLREIFWNGIDCEPAEIELASEMLVPEQVEDDLGSPARATTTFLRYELRLRYEPARDEVSGDRIALTHESLTHITKGAANRHLHFPHSSKDFRSAVVLGQRRGGPFLSTSERDGNVVVNVHGDGGSFSRPQPRPAGRSNRTVLSTMTTNDNPTALAARREMQSWRRLSLEPSAMRQPDSFTSPNTVGVNGSHIAATLWRIARSAGPDGQSDPDAVYARIAGRLSDLLGSRVAGVDVDRDLVREVYTLYLDEGTGRRLPARALSEGTLRFLALCILLEDSDLTGLICMEEPENGIHPANLAAMMELVRDLAVDPRQTPDADNPFRQVIVNTHSPGVVQLCDEQDLVLARVSRRDAGLELLGYEKSWRNRAGSPAFGKLDALPYLAPPKDGPFQLPPDFAV